MRQVGMAWSRSDRASSEPGAARAAGIARLHSPSVSEILAASLVR